MPAKGIVKAPKNIALFIDGTWDQPCGAQDTNVRKLFEASRFDPFGPAPQVTYYLPGMNCENPSTRCSGRTETAILDCARPGFRVLTPTSAGAMDAKADSFGQATTEQQNILFGITFGRGTRKPTVAPSLASFRKHIALKAESGTSNLRPE